MKKIKIKYKKIEKLTDNYEEWLVDSLRNKNEAALYLKVALEEYQKDGCIEAFTLALRDIAKAQGGFTKLADKTNLNREALYRSLSKNGNPSLKTLRSLLNALGFKLDIKKA